MEISNSIQGLLQKNRSQTPETVKDLLPAFKETLKQYLQDLETELEQTPIEALASISSTQLFLILSLLDETTKVSELLGEIDYNNGDVITEELLQRIEKKLDHSLSLGFSNFLKAQETDFKFDLITEQLGDQNETLKTSSPEKLMLTLLLRGIISKKPINRFLFGDSYSSISNYDGGLGWSVYENLYEVGKSNDCCLEAINIENNFRSKDYFKEYYIAIPGAKVGQYWARAFQKDSSDPLLYRGNFAGSSTDLDIDFTISWGSSFDVENYPLWIIIPIYKKEDDDSKWELYETYAGVYRTQESLKTSLKCTNGYRPEIESVYLINRPGLSSPTIEIKFREIEEGQTCPKFLGIQHLYFVTAEDLYIEHYEDKIRSGSVDRAITLICWDGKGFPSSVKVRCLFSTGAPAAPNIIQNSSYMINPVSIQNPIWTETTGETS